MSYWLREVGGWALILLGLGQFGMPLHIRRTRGAALVRARGARSRNTSGIRYP